MRNTELDVTEAFQRLDQMISDHDADADGPKRQNGEPFQWRVVLGLASSLAEDCADLRVGIWLVRASLATETLMDALKWIKRLAQWCELPADQVYPKSDPSEDPREIHSLTLDWLNSAPAHYALVQARLHPLWPITLGTLHQDSDLPKLESEIRILVLSQLADAMHDLNQIEAYINDGRESAGLSLSQIRSVLADGHTRLLDEGLQIEKRIEQEGGENSKTNSQVLGSALNSRSDVNHTLDTVIQYFKVHEPGHPAPLFLSRVQRMLGASFEELMQELYQDAPQLVAKLDKPASH